MGSLAARSSRRPRCGQDGNKEEESSEVILGEYGTARFSCGTETMEQPRLTQCCYGTRPSKESSSIKILSHRRVVRMQLCCIWTKPVYSWCFLISAVFKAESNRLTTSAPICGQVIPTSTPSVRSTTNPFKFIDWTLGFSTPQNLCVHSFSQLHNDAFRTPVWGCIMCTVFWGVFAAIVKHQR